MTISRRELFGHLAAGGGLIAGGGDPLLESLALNITHREQENATDSQIGNLYSFVQGQADQSPLSLSFLRPEFKSLKQWQVGARMKLFELLSYAPPAVAPQPRSIRQTDRGDYVEEYLSFQTTPDLRVPAYLLIPKKAKLPAPGIVVLHSHDGIYLWGKEKVIEGTADEHPYLTAFKQERYGGKGIAAELARQGYVVITIDMFYWGERRMLLEDDPVAYRERPRTMAEKEVAAFNQRSSQNEQLVARSLFTAGVSWPGIVLWDDIRTLDYLASRPEVDKRRLGCVGLSVGGWRSFLLAALDERIKTAVDVGWMTSLGAQIKRQIIHTIGFSFYINGLYRYFDLPDLAALIAPRAVLVINGSQDRLFALDGVKAAFAKISGCYNKAEARERQHCSLYDAPHEFNLAMQAEAWEWIKRSI
jgi:dienelactone hydrolase